MAEVIDCLARGVLAALPQAEILSAPMVDGGEGFTETLVALASGRLHRVAVTGPVGLPVEAQFSAFSAAGAARRGAGDGVGGRAAPGARRRARPAAHPQPRRRRADPRRARRRGAAHPGRLRRIPASMTAAPAWPRRSASACWTETGSRSAPAAAPWPGCGGSTLPGAMRALDRVADRRGAELAQPARWGRAASAGSSGRRRALTSAAVAVLEQALETYAAGGPPAISASSCAICRAAVPRAGSARAACPAAAPSCTPATTSSCADIDDRRAAAPGRPRC